MAVDERARHQLYLELEEVLGPERAATLMELLPPVGWADVATKHDLDLGIGQLEQRILLKIEATSQEVMATFRSEFARQTRTMVFSFAMMFLGLVGLLLGVHLT